MAANILHTENYANMTLAVAGMRAAIDAAGLSITATTQCGVMKIGSGNYGFWVIYT